MVKTVNYTIPASWLSYLINSDPSGIEDDEVSEADAFIQCEMSNNNYTHLSATATEGESYFKHYSN